MIGLVVVEDDADMRAVIKVTLMSDPRLKIAGEAATAAEAIELARTVDPALVILDHTIEGDVMGLQAAPLLKQAAPESKILLFTAYDLAEEAASEPAVDAYLRKDSIRQLLPTVQHLLSPS